MVCVVVRFVWRLVVMVKAVFGLCVFFVWG